MNGRCLLIALALSFGMFSRAQADPEERAVDILKQVVAANGSWLDPRPKVLSYKLTGGAPAADSFEEEMVHSVFISGDKVRWEMDAGARSGAYVCTPEQTVRLRGPERAKAVQEISDTRPFRQGMTWRTALHTFGELGVPEDCQIIEDIPTRDGGIVVIEAELANMRPHIGLGLYHMYFGRTQWRADKVRLSIRRADLVPIREEYELPSRDGNQDIMTITYEFRKMGRQVAPSKLRFASTTTDRGQRHEWALEGRFHVVQGVWLLDEATNIQNGIVVRGMKVSDVSIAPIADEVFDAEVVDDTQIAPQDRTADDTDTRG